MDRLLLKGNLVSVAQKSAQGAGLLAEDDLVSPLLGHDGRLQTAGAAAGNENSLGRSGQERHYHILGAVKGGIDGALGNPGLVVRDAFIAAQAGADLILISPLELVDEHGVGIDRPADRDYIHRAVFQNLLNGLWRTVGAHAGNIGLLEMLFDLLRQVEVVALAVKDAWNHETFGLRKIEVTGRDMDNIGLAVHQLRKLHGILKGEAAVHIFGAAHADLNDVVRAAVLAHPVDDHQQQAAAVFDAAPEAIRAVVGRGG